MAVEPQSIRLATVAAAADVRLDPHHYTLYERAKDLATGMLAPLPLREPLLHGARNGINLPQEAYATEHSDDYLYASVAAFSQFAFRPDRCQALRPPESFAYGPDIAKERCMPEELIITRSGTPGIAWAGSLAPEPLSVIVPSGFVIRAKVRTSVATPVYVAAVLNHPAWRIWSASLAGGKRQRNLGQEHVAQLAVPALSAQAQDRVVTAYVESLKDIDVILASDVSIRTLCDNSLAIVQGFPIVPLDRAQLTFDRVSLSTCLSSPSGRLDARYHRSDVRASLASLEELPTVELRSLTEADVIKGKQPHFLGDDVTQGGRVVATASIQAGRVQEGLLKLTNDEAVAEAGSRLVQSGDIVVAMDGEGSIGKAAVYRSDEPAITDSHVGLVRLVDPSYADAIACFINASPGQAQIEVSISGATGQTQLSKQDLHRLRIPVAVLSAAGAIGSQYVGGLKAYEPSVRRVRRRLCTAEESITGLLLEAAELDAGARALLEDLHSENSLMTFLDQLRPSMF